MLFFMCFRIYLVRNPDRIRSNDHIVVQEYIDKVNYLTRVNGGNDLMRPHLA